MALPPADADGDLRLDWSDADLFAFLETLGTTDVSRQVRSAHGSHIYFLARAPHCEPRVHELHHVRQVKPSAGAGALDFGASVTDAGTSAQRHLR